MAEVKGCNRLAPVRSPGAAAPFKAVTPFRRAAGVHAHFIPVRLSCSGCSARRADSTTVSSDKQG